MKQIIKFFILLTIIFSGCKQQKEVVNNEKLRIVVTTGMIGDAVKNISGDLVEVITLMGPGVDPHLYEATQGDLEKLNSADLIFYNGLHLEGKMGEVFEKLGSRKPVLAVSSSGIPTNQLLSPEGFENTHDPHIWFDVKLWSNAVQFIGKSLMEKDSVHAAIYQENLSIYLKKLDSLDQSAKDQIGSIPENVRVLITAHDAFNYFGRAYQMEVRGLQGISTMSDFGLNDISQLVDYITKRKIKAVFVESSVSPKAIEAVIEGCKSRGHGVKLGGTLYSDAMGAEGTADGTYIGMVGSNVRIITESLK